MSIQSRRTAAIHLLNSSAGLCAHQVGRNAFEQRTTIVHLNTIRMLHQLTRKSGQLVLKLIGRREVMVDLDQEQANHSRNVVNIDLSVGDVLRVIKIDHLDGPTFRLERKAYAPSGPKWSPS